MGTGYVTNPLEFLINTLFGLYIMTVMLRFLLAVVKADFYNPVSQFLVKITNPPLIPLRRIIPSTRKIDTSALVLMLILQLLSFTLISLLRGGPVAMWPLLILSLRELSELALNVFLFSIFIQVIISWVNPGAYNPVVSLLYSITEPVLRPCRRIIPPISGMDLSPLVALIAIQLAKFLILPLFLILL
ncbi:Cell division integral membrane protein, YggT and half-length relatives [hydrothermal vent metagenome]|uniref:Cell division integral membrane protein, YggT and half-length relatives n=1 Tax=hydrothermal vent metagenome TaxID=652676 RepID=A0A3B0ZFM3_9ZZZZ